MSVVTRSFTGMGIGDDVVEGPAVTSTHLHPLNPADVDDGAVLVVSDLTPDLTPMLGRAVAVVAKHGGVVSHAAIVCRELDVPCVVGVDWYESLFAEPYITDGQLLRVDAAAGTVDVVEE